MGVRFLKKPRTSDAKVDNKKNIRYSGKTRPLIKHPDLLDAMLEEAGAPRLPSVPLPSAAKDHLTMPISNETRVYRRRQIMRLILRGVHPAQVAEHLGLPLRLIKEDMLAINQDMRRELQELDYVTYIGMAVQFYDEVRSMAMRVASNPRGTARERTQGMRAALDAESRKHEFMTKVGLFKVVSPTDPFKGIQTGRQGSYSDENDMNQFVNLASKALSDTRRTVDAEDVKPH